MSHSILDARELPGPFAIIGDVHNCVHTLETLLNELGGSLDKAPPNLTMVSVGDLTDKGPAQGSIPVLRWALEMRKQGNLLLVNSNHGARLARALEGKTGKGMRNSNTWPTYLALKNDRDFAKLGPQVRDMLASAPAAIRLQSAGHELVVAHAAASERLLAATSLNDAEVRFHIASREFRWRGIADVIVGHMGVDHPIETRETRDDGTPAGRIIRIDTNVDQGGHLSAYLPHERRYVSVPTDMRDVTTNQTLTRA